MPNYRKDFPIFQHNPDLIYLDSAATAQKPAAVIQAVKDFYEQEYASVHRGLYPLSQRSTERYEGVRQSAAEFIQGKAAEVVFTKNATEGLNLLATGLVQPGDQVILSQAEHHANLVPWQQRQAKLEFTKIKKTGELDLEHFRTLLTADTKVVSLAHISNVLGTITPLAEIRTIMQERGSKAVLIGDVSQSIAHLPISAPELGVDFLVFSSHKLYGPSGVGVLWGREELLEQLPPHQTGGDMIETVSFERSTWNRSPWKFEAGTPNMEGVIGLGAAIHYLNGIGMEQVARHCGQIQQLIQKELRSIDAVTIIGQADPRSGLTSFTVEEIHPHDLAQLLGERGICIRAGQHCAAPLHSVLALPATNRVSTGIYTDETEVRRFIAALKEIIRDFQHV